MATGIEGGGSGWGRAHHGVQFRKQIERPFIFRVALREVRAAVPVDHGERAVGVGSDGARRRPWDCGRARCGALLLALLVRGGAAAAALVPADWHGLGQGGNVRLSACVGCALKAVVARAGGLGWDRDGPRFLLPGARCVVVRAVGLTVAHRAAPVIETATVKTAFSAKNRQFAKGKFDLCTFLRRKRRTKHHVAAV